MKHMDSDLYLAVVGDKIDFLEGNDRLQFHDQRTPANNTALHIACRHGSIRCVQEILDRANESLLLLKINSRGETALHLAARQGSCDVVEALINKAKTSQPHNLENTSSTVLQKLIRAPNVEFETALHVAVRHNNEQVVKLLVKEDPSYAYLPNKFDETPLYLAAFRLYIGISNAILENCESLTFGGPHGRTALHAALMNYSVESDIQECAELLLGKRTNLIKKADINGWTVFHYAAHNNLISTLKYLLSVDKSVAYLADKNMKTPLHVAAYKGHYQVLHELIECLPDIWESVDGDGRNIFHIAIQQQQNWVISYIFLRNLDATLSIQRDNQGNTPFHLITKFKCYFPQLRDWIWRTDLNLTEDLNLTRLPALLPENRNTPIDEDLVGAPLDMFMIRSRLMEWILVQGPKEDVTPETPKEKITRYRQMSNSHMIVAALVTTVALTAGFAMPGGFDGNNGDHQGSPLLLGKSVKISLTKTAFKTFIVADTVALLCSISSLFFYFLISFKLRIEVIFNLLIGAIVLNVASIAAMMVAFIAGTYAVLSHSKGLALSVSIIGSLFLILVFCFSFIPFERLLKYVKAHISKYFSWGDPVAALKEKKGPLNV